MKIKTKKQLNLPQLIEWGWKNPLLSYGKLYKKDDKEFGDYVSFEHQTNEIRVCGKIDCDDLFTVEVEEEITEDTVITELVELYEDYLECNEILKHENRSISEAKDEDECASQAFYIINDDLTMTLIWRDGKLVE